MERHDWSRLTPLQVGRYAEYFVKMEFTLYGFDVYSSEVDDKGIDFVIRGGQDRYYDVQVKSIRGSSSYIFMPKEKFTLRDNLLAAIVLFEVSQLPRLFLIPSLEWQMPNSLLRDRNYEGKKSKPEWGITISPANMSLLTPYSFEKVVQKL